MVLADRKQTVLPAMAEMVVNGVIEPGGNGD
jgi:hypothetical protein